MACKLATQSFLQKLKLLLIIVCLGSIVTWMGTSNVQELVKEIRQQPVMLRFWKMAKQLEEQTTSKCPPCPPKSSPTPAHMPLCPFLTPYLHGAKKLKFDAQLTLAQVQENNPKVQKGMYAPQECHPLQRVAVLIPYRNRERHLLYLLEHLHPLLQRQLLDYGIYVINQAGNGRFNRAKLLNVGFLEAMKERKWDCFIFHDVDLIPENDFNLYLCDNVPKHLVVGRNATGYKVQLQKMKIVRPPSEIARYTMTFHKRDKGNEVNNDRMKLLREVSQNWKKDGLNSCSYNVLLQDHKPLYINITVDIGDPHHNPGVAA
ncbi:beta-1,4-galactosyltransferase 4 isoform X2 [Pristis pectinata]|uniref:beta-1,4-galactosyltransferase 4 isoform X2 n=1 Tax=Pristis pectinata TaxID=685728 RepID=UPI00223D3162|nr:beta-1,4-galactosyltransferase 4 isoform X2 [Pristis pectinata]